MDPEEFRASVAEEVETLQAAGADVILMNMQYSPRTGPLIALGGYSDGLRWVARKREVRFFERRAIMRNWYDAGVVDLYAATEDIGVAKRVHDCIGRALGSMIVEGARLEKFEAKPAR